MLKSVAGWRHRKTYRRNIYFLSVSQLISSIGSLASYVAMVAVVYQRSGNSGTWVAAALVATTNHENGR